MHYLIVEDDPTISSILRDIFDILETESVFTFAKDGHEAWLWLDQVENGEIDKLPDIAFLDIRLPGPQGHEIAERIRKIPAVQNMGIVMMTAYDLPADEYKEVMRRSQADRYLTKPLPGVQGLNQMVQEIVTLRRSRDG